MREPLIIGHRGAPLIALENTTPAFAAAIAAGADGIEFDVRLSADGVPVIIHDAWLHRTTSGRGRVRHHTLQALQKLDAGSWFNRRYPPRARPAYSRCKIPSLAQALDWVRDRKCLAY